MVTVFDTPLKDAKILQFNRIEDDRGWFCETYRPELFKQYIPDFDYKFEFTTMSSHVGTVRGFHAQTAVQPQAKLVTCLYGSIQDVIIDARIDSPTYGKSFSVILNRWKSNYLYVPRGFYHGFVTLDSFSYVLYKLDNFYNKEEECGVMYNDPTLNIDWMIKENYMISDRDKAHPNWDQAYKFQGTL